METVGRSRDRVEDLLTEWESTYGSFSVTQTTVTVDPAVYERAVERCREGVARADVHVHNDEGEVLLVDAGDGTTVPGTLVDPDDALESKARDIVSRTSDVECRVDDLQDVTIVGIHDERNPDESVYRLVAILSATYVSGTASAGCQWTDDPPESELVV